MKIRNYSPIQSKICNLYVRHNIREGGKSSGRGFTLIELLVVIAIISILAAILFPIFAQAKAAAKKVNCISNQKQISLAWLMYAGDYDDAALRPGQNYW